jgi:hypothetical protein
MFHLKTPGKLSKVFTIRQAFIPKALYKFDLAGLLTYSPSGAFPCRFSDKVALISGGITRSLQQRVLFGIFTRFPFQPQK